MFWFSLYFIFLIQETKLILVSDCYLGFEQEHSLPKFNWYGLLAFLNPIWRNATIPTVVEFQCWWHEIENGWLWSLVDEGKMVICTISRDWHQYQTARRRVYDPTAYNLNKIFSLSLSLSFLVKFNELVR